MATDTTLSTEFIQNQRRNSDQLYRIAPVGLCHLDCDLKYIYINEWLAAISGMSSSEHIGQSLHQTNPAAASIMEPFCLKVLDTRKPIANIEVRGSKQAEEIIPPHWLSSYYPLVDRSGEMIGVSVAIQDISACRKSERIIHKRLYFETMLSKLSAAFVNIAPDKVDAEIESWLKQLVNFLNLDRISIGEFGSDGITLHVTHFYARPGIQMPLSHVDQLLPWFAETLRRDEIIIVNHAPYDFPKEAVLEKQRARQTGLKSCVAVPLAGAGIVMGSIFFATFLEERIWREDLVQRFRLVGEVIANAVIRKRNEEKLQNALSQIKSLKERLQTENHYLKEEIDVEHNYEDIVGHSKPIKMVVSQVKTVAATDATVLITGETGTGKELVARAIHNLSPRKERTLVKVNCSAMPTTLVESELFGHEKGSYTGALKKQIGRFEVADGSTIFLDEIGELPPGLQVMLLRVLQEGQFERLGSSKTINVDVRLVVATNRDLEKAVRGGSFRKDLFYRLNVFPIRVPPLRERKDDISELLWFFVREFGDKMGKSIDSISRKSLAALQSYDWPGNIRELKNIIERAMILCSGSTLHIDLAETPRLTPTQGLTLEAIDRKHILDVLDRTYWRISGMNGAAKILGLKPTTLRSRMQKLGIKREASLSKFRKNDDIS